ncbi:MAG: radical SAM protein [Chloroflexota bacterium]|nr:radical SAM protein [Chloroflexota bacterium]
MQTSRYNYFFRVDGQTILAYNSFTTALVEMSAEEFGYLQDFFEYPQENFFEIHELAQFKDQLVEMGIVIPDDRDEIEQIRAMRLALKRQDRRFGLTIVPTLNCNFRCSYCFSYSRKARMGPETQLALLRFAEENLREAESLSISWFGGEPTLCIDIIEALSAKFAALCEIYDVPMNPGSIVTNGYLLTERVAKRLKNAGISRAQITLDGDRDTHDRRRPLRSGRGTFDRIVDNVARTCEILETQIRINVDRSNAHTATGALEALESRGLQGKVGIYFGHVKPFTEACADIAAACLSGKEFSELDLALTKEALSRGFTSFPYPRLQLDGVCGADKRLIYVVSPDGLLFKCWAEASLGPAWSVGSVFGSERTPQQEENLAGFLDWDPLAYGQCQDCRLLPICMGGCPHLRIRHNAEADCSTWRYGLLETLAIRYKLGSRIQPRGAHAESGISSG